MSQRSGEPDRVLNAQGIATRNLILDTAGWIFGSRGYAGTYLRDISSESGVGLSSILYHFQSKQNLYLQTIQHFVIDAANLNEHFDPLRHVDCSDPQAVSNALRDTCRSFMEVCHGPNQVPYLNELYAHIMVGEDKQALGMLLSCFVEIQQFLPGFVRRVRPTATDADVAFWVQLLWSQLQYTVMGKRLVLYDMQLGDSYTPQYLDEAAWRFALHCALPLGLPEPERFDR